MYVPNDMMGMQSSQGLGLRPQEDPPHFLEAVTMTPEQFMEMGSSQAQSSQQLAGGAQIMVTIPPSNTLLRRSAGVASPISKNDLPATVAKLQNLGSSSNLHTLTPTNLQTLTSSNLQTLSSNLQNLTPSNLQNLTSSNLQNLTPSNLQNLTPSNLQNLTPSNLQNLAPSNLQNLASTNLQAFTRPNLQTFSASNLQSLSKPNLQTLTSSNHLSSSTSLQALTQPNLQTLTSSNHMTPSASLQSLTQPNIQTLTSSNHMTPSSLQSLTQPNIQTLTSSNHLTPSASLQALTQPNIQTLTSSNLLTPSSNLQALTPTSNFQHLNSVSNFQTLTSGSNLQTLAPSSSLTVTPVALITSTPSNDVSKTFHNMMSRKPKPTATPNVGGGPHITSMLSLSDILGTSRSSGSVGTSKPPVQVVIPNTGGCLPVKSIEFGTNKHLPWQHNSGIASSLANNGTTISLLDDNDSRSPSPLGTSSPPSSPPSGGLEINTQKTLTPIQPRTIWSQGSRQESPAKQNMLLFTKRPVGKKTREAREARKALAKPTQKTIEVELSDSEDDMSKHSPLCDCALCKEKKRRVTVTATSPQTELPVTEQSTEGKEKCQYCGVFFAAHIIFHHRKLHFRERFFSCIDCGKNFQTETGLESHKCQVDEIPAPS